MGYSKMLWNGRWVKSCDICDERPGRQYNCPYGYCGGLLLCKECKAKRPELTRRAYHAHCKVSAEKMQVYEAEKAALLAQGKYLRVAAIAEGENLVRVTFQNRDGKELEYLMHRDTYHAGGVLTNMTPVDYNQLGTLYMGDATAVPGFEPMSVKEFAAFGGAK